MPSRDRPAREVNRPRSRHRFPGCRAALVGPLPGRRAAARQGTNSGEPRCDLGRLPSGCGRCGASAGKPARSVFTDSLLSGANAVIYTPDQRSGRLADEITAAHAAPSGRAHAAAILRRARPAGLGSSVRSMPAPASTAGPARAALASVVDIRMTAVAVVPAGAVRPIGGGHSAGRCHVRRRGCRCRASARRRAYRA